MRSACFETVYLCSKFQSPCLPTSAYCGFCSANIIILFILLCYSYYYIIILFIIKWRHSVIRQHPLRSSLWCKLAGQGNRKQEAHLPGQRQQQAPTIPPGGRRVPPPPLDDQNVLPASCFLARDAGPLRLRCRAWACPSAAARRPAQGPASHENDVHAGAQSWTTRCNCVFDHAHSLASCCLPLQHQLPRLRTQGSLHMCGLTLMIHHESATAPQGGDAYVSPWHGPAMHGEPHSNTHLRRPQQSVQLRPAAGCDTALLQTCLHKGACRRVDLARRQNSHIRLCSRLVLRVRLDCGKVSQSFRCVCLL